MQVGQLQIDTLLGQRVQCLSGSLPHEVPVPPTGRAVQNLLLALCYTLRSEVQAGADLLKLTGLFVLDPHGLGERALTFVHAVGA